MATIWGQSEIFWTATEAIGTICAFALAFAILLWNQFSSKIMRPNIHASRFEIEPKTRLVSQNMAFNSVNMGIHGVIRKRLFIISWRIFNGSRFVFFGADAFDVKTHVWFDKKSAEVWGLNTVLDPVSILPRGDTLPQQTEFEVDKLEPGDYEVYLHFTVKDQVVGKKKAIVTYDPEPLPEE